jgi:hypothetical protein
MIIAQKSHLCNLFSFSIPLRKPYSEYYDLIKYQEHYMCAGKSVFTEKPAGESVSDIRKCYETAEENGLTLVTGYTR